MKYDDIVSRPRTHSALSEIALGLAVVALVLALVLAGAVYVQRHQVLELEKRWLEAHDRITVLEHQVERCDAVLDRALDATAIARAVLEESRAER